MKFVRFHFKAEERVVVEVTDDFDLERVTEEEIERLWQEAREDVRAN